MNTESFRNQLFDKWIKDINVKLLLKAAPNGWDRTDKNGERCAIIKERVYIGAIASMTMKLVAMRAALTVRYTEKKEKTDSQLGYHLSKKPKWYEFWKHRAYRLKVIRLTAEREITQDVLMFCQDLHGYTVDHQENMFYKGAKGAPMLSPEQLEQARMHAMELMLKNANTPPDEKVN